MNHPAPPPASPTGLPTADETLQQLVAKRASVSDQGRPDAAQRQHRLGKYTARERIALLVDPGSFQEIGALVEPDRSTFDTEGLQAPADGVLTGYARIGGRPVCLTSYDFTVVGGSNGNVGEHKVERLALTALEHGYPLVMLLEGGGHRIQEGLDSRHFAAGGSGFFQVAIELSGWVPVVAAVMGPGFAGPANAAAIADFVVMVRPTATLGVAGPFLVEASSGEKIDKWALGGADTQVDRNGLAHRGADTEEEALACLRTYLGYLPTNSGERPPAGAALPPDAACEKGLAHIVPDSPRQPYDMLDAIRGMVDRDSIFEVQPTFAANLVTCFARFEGRPVGIIANQPRHLAGTLDARACEKGAHFISVCDAFGLPLVYLVDVPGFLVGSEAESTLLARRSARLLFELGQATVPRISIVLRKGYGLGYLAMCGGRAFDADLCVAWPTAEICAMSVDGAVDVAYRRLVSEAPDPAARRAALIARFRTQLGALQAAEHFGIDDVIDPRETRSVIVATLERCAPRKMHRRRAAKVHAISPI